MTPPSHCFFIGGAPCAGKSTLAERLARELGLPHYRCDDHFSRHLDEAAAAGCGYATILQAVTHEYIFLRSDADNLALALGIHGEEFAFILADLAAQPGPLIAEGCSLLPAQVAAAGIPAANAVYLVPSEAFHRDGYRQRTWARDRLQETSDPERAFENWMRRDALLARRVHADARAHGFPVHVVDHRTDFEALYTKLHARAAAVLAR